MCKLTCKSTTFFLHTQIEGAFFLETALFFVDFAVFQEQKEGRYKVTPLFLGMFCAYYCFCRKSSSSAIEPNT